MTFKFSFFGIPQGGAKAGLRLPYEASPAERHRLIAAAAQHLEPLLKRSTLWSPWTDMNFYGDDLRVFLRAIDLTSPWSLSAEGRSSVRTAIQAIWSVEACAGHFFPRQQCSVALEGYGAVGEKLAAMLTRRGFRVIAVSNDLGAVVNPAGLDVEALADAKRRHGRHWVDSNGPWSRIEKRELLTLDADILMPGARVHTINAEVAGQIRARLVVPVANVPCTPEALDTLERRAIAYMPDFVVGGGGACGWISSIDDEYGTAYRDMFARMLQTAERRGVTPLSLCESLAHSEYGALSAAAYPTHSIGQRVLSKARAWSNVDETRGLLASKIRRVQDMFQDKRTAPRHIQPLSAT
jgi:glutamate dehydrogenase/leucine dehydrogenase